MKTKNAWRYEIPSIDEIVSNPNLRDIICNVVNSVLTEVGQSSSSIQEITEILFDKDYHHDIFLLEKILHNKIVNQEKNEARVQTEMFQRAQVISHQIEKHLIGDSIG